MQESKTMMIHFRHTVQVFTVRSVTLLKFTNENEKDNSEQVKQAQRNTIRGDEKYYNTV